MKIKSPTPQEEEALTNDFLNLTYSEWLSVYTSIHRAPTKQEREMVCDFVDFLINRGRENEMGD